MFRRELLAIVSATVLLGGCSEETTTTPQEQAAAAASTTAVGSAMALLGMEDMSTITYSGTAWRIRNGFMQTPNASPPWPLRDTITNYQRTIDLNQPASRATGETFAQNLFFAPAVAGTYTQNVAVGQTAWGQQLEIWLTPWGFLKGAAANGAVESSEVLEGATVTEVTWKSPATQLSPGGMQYTVTGYINAQNQVQQIETWVEDPFLGDMHVVALYSDYQNIGGVMVPATMEQQRGGGGIFGVTVTAASANPTNAAELLTIPPPAAPPGAPPAAPAAPTELAQQVAPGVYVINGGYVALAVEFSDHIVVFEAGQPETRGQQILDEVKRVIPGKPIRYLVNSHPHSDHTGGMVPFVKEGATIITHENNVAFLDMALSTPRTLLGQATLDPTFRGVTGVTVLEDDTMRLELHHIVNNHSDGTLIGYLPKQRVLIQADFTLPVGDAAPNPFVVNLAEYVDANGLDFDQYLAVHAAAAPQTKAELMATIGK